MVYETRANASRSASPESAPNSASNPKKRSSEARLDGNGDSKPVKRRAAKACAACRGRKVRCDVMQRYHITVDGKTKCSNCTMDSIDCVIEESKRRRKQITTNPSPPQSHPHPIGQPPSWADRVVNPSDLQNQNDRRWSGGSGSGPNDSHISHAIYQNANDQLTRGDFMRKPSYIPASYPLDPTDRLMASASIGGDLNKTRINSPPPAPPAHLLRYKLPAYLKPLPPRLTSVDIDYLFAKSALMVPESNIRDSLLRAYVEYVHPYMPLVELHEVLKIVNDDTGESGKISLLLFQAIMFAGTAFTDAETLSAAGYSNRKAARKAFFQKTRVLYDFDVENDRVALVQSLLLMTYWYETPDDQKDTWHWMGVAISLAHTIGLHRNPDNSDMPLDQKRLWKRIWWSCLMRDRLVALGMRRPTRVKIEDYDVPMLEESDFEITALSERNNVIPADCTLIRDVDAQRQLCKMCIAKAQLCLCISHVLTAQYSVLVKHQGMQGQEGSTRSSVMLFPKRLDQTDEVQQCDDELKNWIDTLPIECRYTELLNPDTTNSPIFVQKALLHMIFFTTVSALHRPQVLPSASFTQPDQNKELQNHSQKKVRHASREITRISTDLSVHGLERYLPTTGVTVLLPAIIIHLLHIKSLNEDDRKEALYGFTKCMVVLEKLRDNYSSADYATIFLEAAIKKADIGSMINQHASPNAEVQEQRLPSPSAIAENSKNNDLHRNLQRLSESDQMKREARTRLSAAANANNINNTTRTGFQQRFITPPSDTEIASLIPRHHNQPVQQAHANRLNGDDQDIVPKFSLLQAENSNMTNARRNRDINPSQGPVGFLQAPVPYPEPAYEDNNFDVSDFLNFESTAGLGGAPDNGRWGFGVGTHGESGGFLGDEDFIGYATAFSRVGSPSRGMPG